MYSQDTQTQNYLLTDTHSQLTLVLFLSAFNSWISSSFSSNNSLASFSSLSIDAKSFKRSQQTITNLRKSNIVWTFVQSQHQRRRGEGGTHIDGNNGIFVQNQLQTHHTTFCRNLQTVSIYSFLVHWLGEFCFSSWINHCA